MPGDEEVLGRDFGELDGVGRGRAVALGWLRKPRDGDGDQIGYLRLTVAPTGRDVNPPNDEFWNSPCLDWYEGSACTVLAVPGGSFWPARPLAKLYWQRSFAEMHFLHPVAEGSQQRSPLLQPELSMMDVAVATTVQRAVWL